MGNLLLNQLLEFLFIHLLAFIEGLLVLNCKWRVNYTRKINHFFVFFSPYLFKFILPYEESLKTQIMIAVVGLSTLAIYLKPIREKFTFVATMFAAFDRPEDRPHTLQWLFTQYLATYLVAIPLWLVFEKLGHTEAIPIIILINAIGDGLAEPVGIMWGKNKYQVRALFTSQLYERSLQGSACVFLVAVLALLLYRDSFTFIHLLRALIILPAAATLAEAKSPHTWDSPFIFLFSGLSLMLVYST